MEVAAVTGARVSQLSRLEVQDLQECRTDPRLMMPNSRKGRGKKKILRRPVPIPAGLATKLRGIVKDRPLDAALLVKPGLGGPEPFRPRPSRLLARAIEEIRLLQTSLQFAVTVATTVPAGALLAMLGFVGLNFNIGRRRRCKQDISKIVGVLPCTRWKAETRIMNHKVTTHGSTGGWG